MNLKELIEIYRDKLSEADIEVIFRRGRISGIEEMIETVKKNFATERPA